MTVANQDIGESPSRVGIWASILYTAIAGNLFIALSPMFWGGYIDYLHLTDAVTGELMSTEFFGATAATVAGIFYMHRDRLNLRYVTYAALSVYAIGNYATPHFFADPSLLRVVRFICGLSSGTVFLATATAITSLKDASRLVAIFYGTPYITGFFLQPAMHTIFGQWGFGTSFTLIAVAAAASAVLFPFFPPYAGSGIEVDGAGEAPAKSVQILLLLSMALLLQYVGNSGVWLFFDRIGTLSGHAGQTTANIVGLGTGMALAGTALAALLAKKLSPLYAIVIGTGVLIVSSVLLHLSETLVIYAAAVLMFNMMITFLTPFYFLLLVKIFDPPRAVVAGNVCLMLGFSLGPLLIGHTVRGNDFTVAINTTVGLFVMSILIVLIYARMARRALR